MVERATVHCAFCLKKQGVTQGFAAQPKESVSALPLQSPDRGHREERTEAWVQIRHDL